MTWRYLSVSKYDYRFKIRQRKCTCPKKLYRFSYYLFTASIFYGAQIILFSSRARASIPFYIPFHLFTRNTTPSSPPLLFRSGERLNTFLAAGGDTSIAVKNMILHLLMALLQAVGSIALAPFNITLHKNVLHTSQKQGQSATNPFSNCNISIKTPLPYPNPLHKSPLLLLRSGSGKQTQYCNKK